MSNNIREVREGLISQGTTEAWKYSFDTSPVSGTATGTPTLVVYDEKDWSDATSTVVSGSCTLVSTTITTGTISALRNGRTYRCVVRWDVSGGQYRSRYFRLIGEL